MLAGESSSKAATKRTADDDQRGEGDEETEGAEPKRIAGRGGNGLVHGMF